MLTIAPHEDFLQRMDRQMDTTKRVHPCFAVNNYVYLLYWMHYNENIKVKKDDIFAQENER